MNGRILNGLVDMTFAQRSKITPTRERLRTAVLAGNSSVALITGEAFGMKTANALKR